MTDFEMLLIFFFLAIVAILIVAIVNTQFFKNIICTLKKIIHNLTTPGGIGETYHNTPSQHQPQPQTPPEFKLSTSEVLKQLDARMANQFNTTATQIRDLSAQLRNITNRLQNITFAIERLQSDMTELKSPCRESEPEPESVQPPESAIEYPMVKYASVNGNTDLGFIDENLTTEPGEQSAYEIRLTSESDATYRLIDNAHLRSELIAMIGGVIAPYCNYTQESQNITTIRDISAGTLKLYQGVWQVVEKAKIELI